MKCPECGTQLKYDQNETHEGLFCRHPRCSYADVWKKSVIKRNHNQVEMLSESR